LVLAVSWTGAARSADLARSELSFVVRDLGTLPANPLMGRPFSGANAINNRGQIVGDASHPVLGQGTHAVIFDDGKVIDLGTLPGGNTSTAFSINDHGKIVGSSNGKLPTGFALRAVRFEK
jgi:probable HAF family extracellular repeat protein